MVQDPLTLQRNDKMHAAQYLLLLLAYMKYLWHVITIEDFILIKIT